MAKDLTCILTTRVMGPGNGDNTTVCCNKSMHSPYISDIFLIIFTQRIVSSGSGKFWAGKVKRLFFPVNVCWCLINENQTIPFLYLLNVYSDLDIQEGLTRSGRLDNKLEITYNISHEPFILHTTPTRMLCCRQKPQPKHKPFDFKYIVLGKIYPSDPFSRCRINSPDTVLHAHLHLHTNAPLLIIQFHWCWFTCSLNAEWIFKNPILRQNDRINSWSNQADCSICSR